MRSGWVRIFCLTVLLGVGVPAGLQAWDFSAVPGTVLDFTDLNYSWGHSAPDKFVADPEILVLSDGTYLASHSWAGVDYGDTPSETFTKIYRSTDSGASWTYITTLTGQMTGSLFQHGSTVYMFGTTEEDIDGKCVMARSTNGGLTWTQTSFSSISGLGPGSPSNPVLFGGRWWAPKNTQMLSAPTTSDPYAVGSWTLSSGFPGWGPESVTAWATTSITEHQIVASPNLGVFTMAQSKYEKISAVARMDATLMSIRFDNSYNGFVDLPCGEKKFGAAYDSVSGKFYVLGNPNLPSDEAAWGGDNVDMIRNAAAVLSSKDLKHWDVEQIFAYSSDWEHEGYGYLQFDFDGNDMVVAARTASCDIPGATDPNDGRGGHDSNCFTIHKIADFRTAVPDHVVQATGSSVILYERTAETVDQNVPFGNFALGSYASTVADATEVGVSGAWDVYVKRPGGTIYRFDPFGNFLETVSSAPVTGWYSAVLSRPPAGESCWTKSSSGDWKDQTNWHYWGRADTDDEIAVFGTAITGNSTINLASMQRTWNFNTDGDQEGWAVSRASYSVSGGLLSGTSTESGAPYLSRYDHMFYGSDAPTVSIRMKGSENCTVYLYWGDSLDPTGMTYTSLPYTGNGTWQTVSFNMEGVSTWEGKMIASMRIDPRVSTGETFDIDWISIPTAAARIKGMRFNNSASSYTIDGAGLLAIDTDTGNGLLEVVKGSHVIDTLMMLKENTDVSLGILGTLNLSGGINLYGNTLSVSGTGYLKMGGPVYLSNGTLKTDGQRPIYFNTGISGALNGTLEYAPSAGLSPVAGQSYNLLSNVTALGGMTFDTVTLPSLPTGLSWNTSALYTTGTVTIEGEERSLTVSSAYGSPSPSVGTHTYSYGTSLSASVSSPVSGGSTVQYVCTGWTGTGSVPSSGSAANTGSFSITADSSVTWNWSTQYWLDTSAGTGGSVNVGDGWKTANSSVTITATPATGYHFTGWTGDTSPGTINGTQIIFPMFSPRSVTANFAPDQHTLTVTSAYGSPTPSVGVHTYDYGTSLSSLVSSPVTDGTTRYVCDGWDGTGSVPSSGGGFDTGSFTLTQNSTVTWLWYTEYWLDTAATAGGSVDVSDGWKVAGSNVQITATPVDGYIFTGWTGDTSGDTSNPLMTLPMDQARAVTATFTDVPGNTLPYIETFEGYTAGDSILVDGNTNGWISATNSTSAIITNLTYTWNTLYHPVETAEHTKVLTCLDADLSVQIESNAAPINTTVDFMFFGINRGVTPDAGAIGDNQTAFFIDMTGHLNTWVSLDDTGTSNAWHTFSGTSIGEAEWVRITYEFDYTTEARNFFRVALNGVELVPGNGFSKGESSFTPDVNGAWMRSANQSEKAIQTFTIKGGAMLDDLTITTNVVTDFIRPVPVALPFDETFESVAVGDSLFVEGKTNGWYNLADAASTVVTNLTYTWDNLYHPVDVAAHTKVLSCSDADFGIQLVPSVSTDTTVDFMFSGLQRGVVSDASFVEDKQSAFYVDPNGHLNVWCGLDTSGSNNTWITYSSTSISESDWMRITCEFDYTTETRNFFRIILNGVALEPDSGAYSRGSSSFTPDINGEWLLTANQDIEGIETFRFKGDGLVDDLVVTTAAVTDFFKLYTITASAGAHGSVSPLSTNVAAGGSAEFTVTGDAYYRIASLATNGTSAGSFNNDSTATSFIWDNVQAAGTLAATFTEQVASTPANTPYWWLAGYGLTNFEADAAADSDGDGLATWQEEIAGTDPTSSSSVFGISDVATDPQGMVVRWPSVSNRLYNLTRTTTLTESFAAIPGATNIVATPPENVYTNQQADPSAFYKIGVRKAE